MVKSKYVVKKLKPLKKATWHEWTAVRVISRVKDYIAKKYRKFVAFTGTLGNSGATKLVDEATRIGNIMEENQNTINSIAASAIKKEATAADAKVMEKAIRYNESLEKKLEKLLNKKIKIETKNGKSIDLNEALEASSEVSKEEASTALSDLGAELDQIGAGKSVTEATDIEIPATIENTPLVEAKIEPIISPVSPMDIPKPVVDEADLTKPIPAVTKALDAIKAAKDLEAKNQTLTAENQKLTIENKEKDNKLATVEQTNASLSTKNQELTNNNQTLQQQNATQAVSIAGLTKENDALKVSVKGQATLEQKINEYESVIARHEKERVEMVKEVERLRAMSKDNEAQAKKLEIDMYKISKERDYYKSQILALQNALGFSEPIATPTTEAEGKTR